MRALRTAAALLAFASCVAPPPDGVGPTATPEPGVLAVTALLDLSGPEAAAGIAQRGALELFVDQRQVQGAGPVDVRLRIVDVAGSEARLILELRRAAVIDGADAVIVGSAVHDEAILGQALAVAALPALLTVPLGSDPAERPGGRWTFLMAPTLQQLAARAVDETSLREELAPALLVSDARERADPWAAALGAELTRRGLDPLTRVTLPEGDAIPPVVRTGLGVLRSLHCSGLPSSCAAVARSIASEDTATTLYLRYLTTPADVGTFGDGAAVAIWPGSRSLLPSEPAQFDPTGRQRAEFLRAYGERHGVGSTIAASAYDAMSLLVHAAERVGADDRELLRERLEETTLPLIASTYSFGSRRHAGFDPRDLVYLRWTGSALATPLPRPTPTPTPSPSPTAGPSPTSTSRP